MADRSIPLRRSQVRRSKPDSSFCTPSGFARNVRLPIVSLVTYMGVSSNGED